MVQQFCFSSISLIITRQYRPVIKATLVRLITHSTLIPIGYPQCLVFGDMGYPAQHRPQSMIPHQSTRSILRVYFGTSNDHPPNAIQDIRWVPDPRSLKIPTYVSSPIPSLPFCHSHIPLLFSVPYSIRQNPMILGTLVLILPFYSRGLYNSYFQYGISLPPLASLYIPATFCSRLRQCRGVVEISKIVVF